MGPGSKLRVLAGVCILLAASRYGTAEGTRAEPTDSVSRQVEQIFVKAEELTAQTKQRSRDYLLTTPDDEFAQVYARATAPQPQPGAEAGDDRQRSLAAIAGRDRRDLVEELFRLGSRPLDEQGQADYRVQHTRLADELAAIGPRAMPAIAAKMGEAYRGTDHWALSQQALVKMGSAAVEPLMPLARSRDRTLAGNVVEILALSADARTKDVLLQALADESPVIRRNALQGLLRLGPPVVGSARLIAILIEHLEDSACLYESIQGLSTYGDEAALEPLRIVERFHPGVGKKGSVRSFAAEAINSILKRLGKPTQEVERYSDKEPDYDAIIAAATCPNAAIRSMAVLRLEDRRDDHTAGFLIERLHQEKDAAVQNQVIRALGIITTQPQQPSDASVSPSQMQELFDVLVLRARTSSNSDVKQRITAIASAGTILRSASLRLVRLDRVDQFKEAIRQGLSSDVEEVRVTCYSACTAVAMAGAGTTDDWTTQEEEGLVQQLAPLLNTPNPHIRLIECLGFLADEHLTPRFVELLGHNDPIIRTFAAYALGEIRDPQALPALRQLMESDPFQYENGVYGVRDAAQRAVVQIGEKQG